MDQLLHTLKRSIFKYCTSTELENILLPSINVQDYAHNSTIIRYGDKVQGVYMIIDGCVRLLSESGGNVLAIEIKKKGDIFGHECILTSKSSSKDVITLGEVNAFFIPKNDFLFLLKHNPNFSQEVLKIVCSGLEKTRRRMAHFCYQPVRQRVASAVLYLKKSQDANSDENFWAPRNIVAHLAGTRRETATRLVKELETEGIVSVDGTNKELLSVLNREELIKIKKFYRSSVAG